ncbi:MAG: hypothetical protein VZR73_06770 [Acutalibacteraceae bacterium]|nr:hypothetical protein [Acutalibacteraceae bacterium]
MTDRNLDIMIDGNKLTAVCRTRLTGKDDLSLFPSLFELRLWNLCESDYLAVSRAKTVSVSYQGACLASGQVSDVFRYGTADGVVTVMAFSMGLNLWESNISLTVEKDKTLSETIIMILEASGTEIALLAPPENDIIFPRCQSFYGRAADAIETVLTAISAKAVLTPSGLMIVPDDGLPVFYTMTKKDLTDAPMFAGGSSVSLPPLMILRAIVAGWRPGQTMHVVYGETNAIGIVQDRSVDADTSGTWKSEMIVKLVRF